MEAQFGRQTGRIKLRALDALSLDKANHPLTTVLDCRENSRMDCNLLTNQASTIDDTDDTLEDLANGDSSSSVPDQ